MNKINTFFLSFIFCTILFNRLVLAQVSVTSGNTIIIDFNNFNGSGFTPAPAAGQLDSDNWRVTGLSDGDGAFAGTFDAGDFARGIDSDGVTSGGVYAFEVSTADFSLGAQPTGSDWNPGTFDLKLINNSAAALTEINIQFDIFVLNNADRSGAINFLYSDDDVNYTAVPTLDFASPELADVTPVWQPTTRSATLTGLNIADGAFLYLRWQGTDISGTGSRDEFALDNIMISQGDSPLPVKLNSLKALSGDSKVALHWSTAAEVNNRGFIILRAPLQDSLYEEISSYKYNDDLIGAGTSSTRHDYSYFDGTVLNGYTYWYKILDVDFNGVMEEHGPVSATPTINTGAFTEQDVPSEFALHQNFPNPFNPATTITYEIPPTTPGEIMVNISVFNALGKKVNELYNNLRQAGKFTVSWDGRDQNGKPVAAGIYIYQLSSALFTQTKKMIYLK